MTKFNPAYSIFFAAILLASWPDGTKTSTPATTIETCQDATRAYQRGIGLPHDKPFLPTEVKCIYVQNPLDAGFEPGWDCIKNFNCKK